MSLFFALLCNVMKNRVSMLFSVVTIGFLTFSILVTPASAISERDANRSQSVISPCGVKVYMTASGALSGDATNDTNVKTRLEFGTDLCITIGVQYFDLQTVSANINTTNFDVIYIQGQNNWSVSFRDQFGADDVQVIEDFLASGGGVVIGEWLAWTECTRRSDQAWIDFATIMPVTIRGACDYGTNQKVRFYKWERPASSVLDTGVASNFVFEPSDFAGSLSFLDLKTGATPYYWATWDSVLANVPNGTEPTAVGFPGGVGMAGWVPANYTGRVFSFATTNGALELVDTSSANSFRRLLINSLSWAGSVGGSISPDSVSVSAQVGSAVTTPAFVSSRMTGTITYSITSGTLPNGLTLNTSTGQITGTPTQGGNINVTIQASSSSGQALAAVVINITGSATPASPNTTVASSVNSTVATSTTIAPTTTVANNATPQSLPTTGSSSFPQALMALFILVGGFVVHRQVKRVW